MNKIKFYFSKKNTKKLFSLFSRYRYLFILIFFSIFVAFVFNVVYKHAFVDINFMEYEESSEGKVILNIKKGNRVFKKILVNIEERDKRFEMKKNMKYNNPFEFRKLNASEDEKSGDLDSEAENDPMPENSLILPEPIEDRSDL